MSESAMGSNGHLTEAEAAMVVYTPGVLPALEARARSHLMGCAHCVSRLEALRSADRSTGGLLSALDVPASSKSGEAFLREIQAPKPTVATVPRRRAAAAIVAVMVIAAAAAAAIPGSPLHELIVRAVSGETARTPASPLKSAATPASSSAVSLSQLSSLDVVFDQRGAGGEIHLRVVDGDRASLSSPDSGVAYSVGTNRIAVGQSAPANFQLEVPRALRELRIMLGDEVVFERGRGRATAADTLTILLGRR